MKKETVQIICDRCGKEISEEESKMIRDKGVKFFVVRSAVGYDGAMGGCIDKYDYSDLCNSCSAGLVTYLEYVKKEKK